ncbi:deoxyribonuclease-2-alpha [Microcaecilia unicolor]|uniref:Deoxyribonuclease-2-alpha n=1 Tax=Microcaecilia unicolor TaxID=1415580 RepID=A0A6P7X6B0_9AMPH|nr:deoxyribonuclease-2-alpha [Microcaecilia unicolor]
MYHLLVLVSLAVCARAGISCYGDSGQPVDWFIVYKLPKHKNLSLNDGMRYMYQDATTGGWKSGKTLMNSTEGAVGRTLQQLYRTRGNQSGNFAYILYNDQPPNGFNPTNGGHTKGIVLLDKAQGFWLVHSTPHFPPIAKEEYSWPKNGLHYGQSFLCITHGYDQFKEIGQQLRYNDIVSYDFSITQSFAQDFPDLVCAAKREHLKTAPWNRQVTLTSLGGKKFISFSKYRQFGDDLYSGWVSQALKVDLLVQFWHNSPGILQSNCTLSYHVYNVEQIAFSQKVNFSSTVDHSKWGVSNSSCPWTCIGDMNRNKKEEQRGGGTVCTSDPQVWKSFHALVFQFSDCSQ